MLFFAWPGTNQSARLGPSGGHFSRPLGATVGDFLNKPVINGGLAMSRYTATAWLATFIIACIVLVPQKAERISAD